jgi:prepilin-type N-terminal cleavage/methylation domain-containing protein
MKTSNRINPNNKHGFTIIELMIATMVFSIILLVTLGGFIQIGRTFYKGMTIARTENNLRDIADSISSDVRLSQVSGASATRVVDGTSYFCIGQHIYYFKEGVIYDTDTFNAVRSSFGLKRDNINSVCNDTQAKAIIAAASGEELLGEKMRVSKLAVQCSSIAINRLCDMSIHIAYGDNDLLESESVKASNPSANQDQLSAGPDALCKGATAGTQFCATADINTSILRGGNT